MKNKFLEDKTIYTDQYVNYTTHRTSDFINYPDERQVNDFGVYNDFYQKMYQSPFQQQSCLGCSNHPNNGGSGICHCTLGLPIIT